MSGNLSGASADAENNMGDRPVGGATEPCPNHWIEIELIDEADGPIAGQLCRFTLPDGTTRTGQTNDEGVARLDGIMPGECQISFTELDQRSWERI